MPIEKSYAILEIQKVLLDVQVDAKQYPTDEELYLQVAKETYDNLEQIFRLVLEPTFADDPNLIERASMLKHIADLEKEVDDLQDDLQDERIGYISLQDDFKAAKEEVQRLVTHIGELNTKNRELSEGMYTVVEDSDRIIKLTNEVNYLRK